MTTKLEQAARQVVDAWDLGEFSTRMDEAIIALREALAEPKRYNHETGSVLIPNPLAEQAEHEPVCIDWDTKTDEPIIGYAAPVRTKDLTDKQIEKVWNKNGGYMGMPIDFARAVIAADRRKNETFPNPPTV